MITGINKNELKEFVVVHFAGAVTYDASNFLEKNNDSLFGNLKQIMSDSTNEIIKVNMTCMTLM